MGLLDKLKSLFSDDSTSQTGHSPQDTAQTDVTVEYEPDAESEHAVKGTDQSPETTQAASVTEAETAEEAAESEATEEATEPEPAEAATETETTDESADKATESTDEATASTEESAESAASVEEIKGIGPTYAGRLEAAGIETVADLAAADAADVAEAAETTETRAFDWVERAQAF